MAAELIQIIYDDSQRKACYPFAKVHFNNSLTVFFENSVIVDMVSATKADKIAVCSWRLREKMKYYIGNPRELTNEVLESDYDVLSMMKNTRHHQMLAAADKWHPGFKKTLALLCENIGVNLPREIKIPIYQNHFSARAEIYLDYVDKYLSPAIQSIKECPELTELAMVDSKYSKLDKASHEKLKSLEKQIGIPYYPMAPFILERLFSIYVHNKKINVTHL